MNLSSFIGGVKGQDNIVENGVPIINKFSTPLQIPLTKKTSEIYFLLPSIIPISKLDYCKAKVCPGVGERE